MILISNIVLEVLDGSTIASTEIYGADKKTYINTGSGNVFKLKWTTPVLINDFIDHYDLVIKRHDPTLNIYYDIFNKNIGLVNEFFVESTVLPLVPDQYKLSIYLEALSKYGSVITSNIVSPYISKGCGTYVKVESDRNVAFEQPIMKRALGFVNVPRVMASVMATEIKLADIDGILLADINDKVLSCYGTVATETRLADINDKLLTDIDSRALYLTQSTAAPVGAITKLADINGNVLTDIDDNVLYINIAARLLDSNGDQYVDAAGRALFAPITRLLTSASGWTIMKKSYIKDKSDTWRANDIMYEVLQVPGENGKYEVLLDSANQPIYIL